ncbi:MAG TPA: class I SAM-dependent methyltransferase, partial [Candidatus Babeliaceae bacterium]|nr:class I SAM-dependent methyltransferase [Candidatus Babeliaceae bacterium]
MRIVSSFLFSIGLIFSCAQSSIVQENPFIYSCSDAVRPELSKFIDNVLRQVPSDRFFELIDRYGVQAKSDHELYAKLLPNIGSLKKLWFPLLQLQALWYQKEVLGQQAKRLLGGYRWVHGCLEIGNPGTYIDSMSSFLRHKGPFFVLNDKPQLIDAWPFKVNYDTFIPSNNFDPIKEVDIASDSLDLVVCMGGLHHIPEEKLAGFLASIQRVLRDGGLFILRDHDAKIPEVKAIVSAAHSVYNLIATGESLESELEEYRNFQALDYWINLVESYGFQVGAERLLQEGDPTLNSMLVFTKHDSSAQGGRSKPMVEVSCDCDLAHYPDYNRPLVQTYLSSPEWFNVDIAQEYASFIEHTPFYQFPYFSSIGAYWQVFYRSWLAAADKKGHAEVLCSPSTLMNIFIGVTMTVEYVAKGAVSLPVRMLYAGQEPLVIKALVRDDADELKDIGEDIAIIQEYGDTKLVELPRYKKLIEAISKLEETAVEFIEMAGQKIIQIKVRYKEDGFNVPDGCRLEYSWSIPTQAGYTYSAI